MAVKTKNIKSAFERFSGTEIINGGLRCVAWGSSSTWYANAGQDVYEYADSYMYNGIALSRGALFFSRAGNYGIGGQKTADICARIPTQHDADPNYQVAILQLGANDLTSQNGFTAIESNVRWAVRYLVMQGKKVLLLTSFMPGIATNPQNYSDFNALCYELESAYSENVFVIDLYKYVNQNEFYTSSELLRDGVHTNAQGGYECGRAFIDPVERLVGRYNPYIYDKALYGKLNPDSSIDALSLTVFGGATVDAPQYDAAERLKYRRIHSEAATGVDEFIYKILDTHLVEGRKYRICGRIRVNADSPKPCLYGRNGTSSQRIFALTDRISGSGVTTNSIVRAGTVFDICSIPFVANANSAIEFRFGVNIANSIGIPYDYNLYWLEIVDITV